MGWATAALGVLAALIIGWLVDRRHKGSNRSPGDINAEVERRWGQRGMWF